MHIVIMITVMFAIISLMCLWAKSFTKKDGQIEGNLIIVNFEPDNDAPTLTEMIHFHKDSGIVNYEL